MLVLCVHGNKSELCSESLNLSSVHVNDSATAHYIPDHEPSCCESLLVCLTPPRPTLVTAGPDLSAVCLICGCLDGSQQRGHRLGAGGWGGNRLGRAGVCRD